MNIHLRKYYVKQFIIIIFILLVAVIPTYLIYNNFKDKRDQIRSSESLSITFHESAGDKVSLKDIAPVTDSVGLSSPSYTFTIKNNLEAPVRYSIKLVEDLDAVEKDDCLSRRIPMQVLRLGYHKEKEENKILGFNELTDNTIVTDTIKGYGKVEYTVRVWAGKGTLAADNDLHFHGILQVIENGTDIASAIGVK